MIANLGRLTTMFVTEEDDTVSSRSVFEKSSDWNCMVQLNFKRINNDNDWEVVNGKIVFLWPKEVHEKENFNWSLY